MSKEAKRRRTASTLFLYFLEMVTRFGPFGPRPHSESGNNSTPPIPGRGPPLEREQPIAACILGARRPMRERSKNTGGNFRRWKYWKWMTPMQSAGVLT